jgi:hypothetical protein
MTMHSCAARDLRRPMYMHDQRSSICWAFFSMSYIPAFAFSRTVPVRHRGTTSSVRSCGIGTTDQYSPRSEHC